MEVCILFDAAALALKHSFASTFAVYTVKNAIFFNRFFISTLNTQNPTHSNISNFTIAHLRNSVVPRKHSVSLLFRSVCKFQHSLFWILNFSCNFKIKSYLSWIYSLNVHVSHLHKLQTDDYQLADKWSMQVLLHQSAS